jgi:hypothetical protein
MILDLQVNNSCYTITGEYYLTFLGKVKLIMQDTTKLQDSSGTKAIYLFHVITAPTPSGKSALKSNILSSAITFQK